MAAVKSKTHEWTGTTAEGDKRIVRASRARDGWRFQAKLKSDESWTYFDLPQRSDLVELIDVLERKYARSRAKIEDVNLAKKLLAEQRFIEDENAAEA
jgi:hypothetical protein